MKKAIYTIALLLAAGTLAQAQTPVKQSGAELADFMLLENGIILYTQKEAQGQYIYTERRGGDGTAQKPAALNAGVINALIGRNAASGELFVYQKNGRNEETISFYTTKDGGFEKTGERPLPKLRNHSYNLGLHLSEDKNTLLISAELGRSLGYDDLYLSKWESNRWTKPKNLGKGVNTREAEFAPYLANDTLYFSRSQDGASFVYGAPFNSAEAAVASASRVAKPINMNDSYNAYYKKQNDQVTWVAAASTEKAALHTAYLLEKPKPVVEEAVAVVEEKVEVVVELPAPIVKKRAEQPALVLFNNFNSIHLGLAETSALSRFLKKQPAGTALVVKGYSDGFGSPEAKDYVSRNRAVSVQRHIEKYFPGKGFTVTVENEVMDEKGKAYRKTELYLMQ